MNDFLLFAGFVSVSWSAWNVHPSLGGLAVGFALIVTALARTIGGTKKQ